MNIGWRPAGAPSRSGRKSHLSEGNQVICNAAFASVRVKLEGRVPSEGISAELGLGHPEPGTLGEAKSRLRKLITADKEYARVDYRAPENFRAYDLQYFYRNLYKYCMVASELQATGRYDQTSALEDLGSGVGTFALAWIEVAKIREKRGLGGPPPAAVRLVETGELQMLVAVTLLRAFDVRDIIPVGVDVFQHVAAPDALSLCGYLLTSHVELTTPSTMRSVLSDGAVIVDYRSVLSELVLKEVLKPFQVRQMSAKIHANFLTDVKSTTIHTNFAVYEKTVAPSYDVNFSGRIAPHFPVRR